MPNGRRQAAATNAKLGRSMLTTFVNARQSVATLTGVCPASQNPGRSRQSLANFGRIVSPKGPKRSELLGDFGGGGATLGGLHRGSSESTKETPTLCPTENSELGEDQRQKRVWGAGGLRPPKLLPKWPSSARQSAAIFLGAPASDGCSPRPANTYPTSASPTPPVSQLKR